MSRPERGQYGNTRGKERQRRRRNHRSQQARNIAAAEETARHQEELDKLIERQAANPAMGEVEGARIKAELEERHAARMAEIEAQHDAEENQSEEDQELDRIIAAEPEPEPVPQPKPVLTELPIKPRRQKVNVLKLPQDGEGNFPFALMTARLMLKEGYNIKHVIELTGIGYLELNDLPIDEQGYGLFNIQKNEEVSDEQQSAQVS